MVLFLFCAQSRAQRVRLRAQLTPPCPAVGNVNWKFADIYAEGGIAVQGTYNCRGAFIYDISNPDAPVVASWYNPGENQQFLEAVVMGGRGYFGSGNGGGVHIVDLSDPRSPRLLGIVNSANGNGFGSIHEMLVLRQANRDLLIENFNGTAEKRIKVIDVTVPSAPVFVRDIVPGDPVWVHAMHVRGNRMFTSGWGGPSSRARTEIYDISDLIGTPPVLLGFIEDPSSSVTSGNNMHSSWTSEDGKYLYSAREVSNSNGSSPGDIRVYDVSNPGAPMLVYRTSMSDLSLNAVTPHNPVVFGNKLYVSWYQAGVQVFDISQPRTPRRIGQYDAFPETFVPDADGVSLADAPWDLICGSDALQNLLPTTYDGTWAVFPMLGEDKVLLGDMARGLLVVDVTKALEPEANRRADFDGDRKSDLSTYLSSSGAWSIEGSLDGRSSGVRFGAAEDKPLNGDFDGDGRSDIAVYRPSTGIWYVLGSNSGFTAFPFGASSDIPVPGDYDADGRTDYAVFRPATGVWYIQQSKLGFRAGAWGVQGDLPLVGDYEGDGKSDLAVFRPASGTWYVLQSSSGIPTILQFGLSADAPVSADFDGDRSSDIAVYRPSNGMWWWINSSDGSIRALPFGIATDVPVPADYDGDGKADIAVYRPSDSVWYRINSSDGSVSVRRFGSAGEIPIPFGGIR